MTKFPHYLQTDAMTCGPTCLRMVAKFYGKNYSLAEMAQVCGASREGASLLGITTGAEKIGFRTTGIKVPYTKLFEDVSMPFIAHWNQNHFVVVYKIKKEKIYIADPAHGLLVYTKEEFFKSWVSDGEDIGIILLFEPTPDFYKEKNARKKNKTSIQSFSFLFSYLSKYRKPIIQLIIGLFASSLLQLIFPFLTQAIIDIGVQNGDMHFITLILMAQLLVFFGRTTIEIIRSYILMHISSRINISLASDFFIKLMKFPIAYFDSKMTGDIMQRINDNHRIENFLTSSSLNTIFSLFNFIIFSIVLAFYSGKIFAVFIAGTLLYFLWITFFLKRRADLDYKRFNQSSLNQSKIIELINGMQEIKLHNAERQKRWQWEDLQIKLFKINLKGLTLTTAQNSGSSLINELKNIIITFLAAKLVLDGQLTLGMMLSISYITGQLNAPVMEMVHFIQNLQDAKLSLERLSEIHSKEDEDSHQQEVINEVQPNLSFHISNLSFKYNNIGKDFVLEGLSINIPANKITAIVGSSGSGKSTLMKLLLKFYDPTDGEIFLQQNAELSKMQTRIDSMLPVKENEKLENSLKLKNISWKTWRDRCGVVMQEGYIFSDTIANNIAVGIDVVDIQKLKHAATVANIKEFIENLPLGYNTKIGMEGIGISTGQKQRILIARAVYKNPDYLFFDEATSALDANNEKIIMNNLNTFFQGKTVVVVAHRLSTVKNADQIIVLKNGKVAERGNHIELTTERGEYYELVKNQLELGN